MMFIKYRHKKTGNIYWVTGTAILTTNGSEGQEVTIYQDGFGNTFVRHTNEFELKFEVVL